MKFVDWSVQARTAYTILAWTSQSVNLHIALKAMFYLLNNQLGNPWRFLPREELSVCKLDIIKQKSDVDEHT